MKKLFTLFIAVLAYATSYAATETTVYYSIPEATVGTYTLKLNVNRKGDGDDWKTYVMTQTGNTYNGNPIYTYTFTDLYDGLGKLQFQLYDGNTWKSQEEVISSWTTVGNYNGKMKVYGTSGWIDYAFDEEGVINISFPQDAAGFSITGNTPSTASEGDVITFTVTPAAGYYLTVSATGAELTDNADNTYTFTVGNGNVAINVAAATYYITGTANLVSSAWSATAVHMENASYEFVNLEPGIYEMKITDGTWTNNWGYSDLATIPANVENNGGNIKFRLLEAGNVTVSFDATTKKITLSGNFVAFDAASEYTVVGVADILGTAWDLNNADNLMISAGENTYTLTKEYTNLAAGTYNFKVVGDHDYSVFQYPQGSNNQSVTVEDALFTTIVFTLTLGETTTLTATVSYRQYDYYMIGSSVLFGEAGTKMTDNGDGTYKLMVEKNLAAGNYLYNVEARVESNGQLENMNSSTEVLNAPKRVAQTPTAAKSFTLVEEREYTIRFDYDSETGTLTATDESTGWATAIDNAAGVQIEKLVRDGQVVIIKNGVEYNVLGARL